MMNNISLRNVLVLLVAVIAVLLALGFVSTLLNQIIPITIALVVGVALGRMSTNVNLLTVLKQAIRRAPAQAAATEEKPQSQVAEVDAQDEISARAAAIKQRLEDVDTETAPQKAPQVDDFDIKSEDEILTQARRLEEEVARRNAAYDPAAALEERRRRLLGDKADQS